MIEFLLEYYRKSDDATIMVSERMGEGVIVRIIEQKYECESCNQMHKLLRLFEPYYNIGKNGSILNYFLSDFDRGHS